MGWTGSIRRFSENVKRFRSERRGRSVTFGYDSSTGQLNSYTDATGAKTNYYYDSNGMLSEIKDVSTGNDTTITYYTGTPWTGRVKTITQVTTDCAFGATPQNYTTGYAYTASGGPVTNAVGETDVTDPGGLTSKYYWDAKQRIVRTVDPAGNQQDSSYDSTSGQLGMFKDNVTGGITSIGYDTSNLTKSVTEPATSPHTPASSQVDSRSTTLVGSSYQGPAAVPTKVTDAQGNDTYYTIPHTGQAAGGMDLITQVSQDTDSTHTAIQTLSYNTTAGVKNGTVATIINSNNKTTTYSYSPTTGDLITITPPAPQAATTYTYDSHNRVYSITDGNSHLTTYTYDNNDRPKQVTYDDGTYVHYYYDTLGNLIKRHDRDYTSTQYDTLTYDGLNLDPPVGWVC